MGQDQMPGVGIPHRVNKWQEQDQNVEGDLTFNLISVLVISGYEAQHILQQFW